MRRMMLGLVAISLSACGGGGGSGSSGQAGLNTAFRGLWVGTFTLAGAITGSVPGQLGLSVSGDSMELGYLCPDGTGTVTVSGSGNSASWSGSLVCPPTSGASNCPAGVFTFSSVTSTLSGGTLNVFAQSNLSGCPSGNGPFTLSFSGTH